MVEWQSPPTSPHEAPAGAPAGSPRSPFRNIKPKTREERRAMRDKTALERERIGRRTGPEARLHRANAPLTSDGLVVPAASAAGYLADADRFHTDVSGEEFLRRRAKHEAQQLRLAATRERRVADEEERWQRIQAQKSEEERFWTAERATGEKARKNHSSVPYVRRAEIFL